MAIDTNKQTNQKRSKQAWVTFLTHKGLEALALGGLVGQQNQKRTQGIDDCSENKFTSISHDQKATMNE